MLHKLVSKTWCFTSLSLVLAFLLLAGWARSQGGGNPTYPRLSVGAFGELGRQQGTAGGIRFSGTTLSVNALTGEAPLLVTEATGHYGLAVRPNGDVYIDKNLVVYGLKKFAQPDPNDSRKLITYVALEGPEAGTYTRGTAQLLHGQAVINLPDHFALVTSGRGITIALTPLDSWLQLYVVEKSSRQIVVREAGGRNGRFDYIVNGVRAGYEHFQVIGQRP